MNWLQQGTTVIWYIAGAFLIYQHFRRLKRQNIEGSGILFVVYGVYHFFLVRRSIRR